MHLVITTCMFCPSGRELVVLTATVVSVTRLQLKLWLLQDRKLDGHQLVVLSA
jgi:hypothetical protein